MLRTILLMVGASAVLAAGMTASAQVRTSPPTSGQYTLDPHHSSMTLRVNHLGFSHIVARFDRLQATLDLNAADPARSSLAASVDAASISSGIASFDGFLSGERFLNAARFPEIQFVATSIERTGENTARITGDLTMHGATHPVTLDAVFNAAGRSPFEPKFIAGFSATGTLTRSQWGLGAFAPNVGDDVAFQIEVEFIQPVSG